MYTNVLSEYLIFRVKCRLKKPHIGNHRFHLDDTRRDKLTINNAHEQPGTPTLWMGENSVVGMVMRCCAQAH